MRTSNPAFRKQAFAPAGWTSDSLGSGARAGQASESAAGAMSISGTAIKAGILVAICAACAGYSWQAVQAQTLPAGALWLGGMLGGMVLALIISFAPKTAPFLAPLYAVCEGAFLGAVSLAFAARLGAGGTAMVFQAILLTFGVLAGLLITFALGGVRLGSTAVKCVVVATAGVALFYVASLLLSVFGVNMLSNFIRSSSPLSIGFSVVVVIIASLNLVLDFQFIENGVANRAPKYMEWYAGYGLLVTLVWLYIEILRLLSKAKK